MRESGALLREISNHTGGILPFDTDEFEQSNPDVNGNYQTIVYKRGGRSVKQLDLTYDANGQIINLKEIDL